MVKYFTRSTSSDLHMKTLIALLFVLLTAGLAHATSRGEAQKVMFVLKQTGVVETTPEEMHSVDGTYATAEQYYQQKNREMSERYYLLTIQKARVLLAKLLDRVSDTSAIETSQPENKTLLASIPPSFSDVTPLPREPEHTPPVRQTDSSDGTTPPTLQQSETSHAPAKTDVGPEQASNNIISEKLVEAPVSTPWSDMTHSGWWRPNWESAGIIWQQ